MSIKLIHGKQYVRRLVIVVCIVVLTIVTTLCASGCGTAPIGRAPSQKPIEQVVEELKRELSSGAGIQWRGVTEILAMKQAGVDFILVKVSGTRELDNSGIPYSRDGYRIIVEYLGLPTKPQ